MYQTLDIERSPPGASSPGIFQGAVATIWLNRPAVSNAFDEVLIGELAAVCEQLAADASVRVVVLAGRGKHFCAGADLHWMQRAAESTAEQNLADARSFARMMDRLNNMPQPTVARIHGAALGGGTGLAAACDIALASDDAVFATSEVKFGIIPAVISPYVLRAIGPRAARRYFQTGERIAAVQAQALGLISEVVARDALDETVARLCTDLLAGGPNAQRAAKELIHAISACTSAEAYIEESAQRITRQRATEEAREGFAAFLKKRPPAWAGGGGRA